MADGKHHTIIILDTLVLFALHFNLPPYKTEHATSHPSAYAFNDPNDYGDPGLRQEKRGHG